MMYALRTAACNFIGVLVIMLVAVHASMDYERWKEEKR